MADAGWSILVFPEGELSRDGAIHSFRPGVGILARDLALPVVPARLIGLFGVLPRGEWFPKAIRRPVGVRWGKPIPMLRGEEAEAFVARVEAAVRRSGL
jgi:1-acyl-sn-glycerol-3-phosphate acyltransferase